MISKPSHFESQGQLAVLSVDDDSVNLMVIESLLAPKGWRVISVQDGQEALQELESSDFFPDVVLLDYQLGPGQTGDVVCKEMRKFFGAAPVPIIMCSAMGEQSSAMDACRGAGATDVLAKPYEREAMIAKIEQYCGHKAKQASKGTSNSCNTAKTAPTDSSGAEQFMAFFQKLDLEYCGMKLADNGVTLQDLANIDDATLRSKGIVVKSQREKILANIQNLK